MDKDKVIIDLNSKCEFKRWRPHNHSRAEWKTSDIDIENDKIRSYCVNIYMDDYGSRCAYYNEKLCDSCSHIINNYKNSYMIATSTPNQIFEKILEGIEQIKKDMEKTNKRLNKIEKNIEQIEKSSEQSSERVEKEVEQSNSEPEE